MEEILQSTKKHNICIYERKEAVIEGVLKLDSFDKNEFLINTTKGYLHIKGKDLSLGNMDMDKGLLTINGCIDSLMYLLSLSSSQKKESFLKKLFK